MKQLEHVFLEHHQTLYAAALAITRNRAQAEDSVHEALLAVASLSHQPDDLPAYLYKVVRNKALHSNKQEQRKEVLVEDYAETHGDAELTTLAEQVKDHIGQLGQHEQQALMLKLFGDMTFEEIARVMEASPNTVASWYRRGLIKLKELIDE